MEGTNKKYRNCLQDLNTNIIILFKDSCVFKMPLEQMVKNENPTPNPKDSQTRPIQGNFKEYNKNNFKKRKQHSS